MAKIRLKYEGPHEGGVRLPTGTYVFREEGDDRPLHVVFPGEEVAVEEELAGWPPNEEKGDPGHGFLASDFWSKAKGGVSKVPPLVTLDDASAPAPSDASPDVEGDGSDDEGETETGEDGQADEADPSIAGETDGSDGADTTEEG